MIKRIYIFSLIILLFPITSEAQSLTLDECIKLALNNNVDIINSKLTVDEATLTRREAFTKYFPDVSVGGASFKAADPLVDMSFSIAAVGLTVPIQMLKDGNVAAATAVQPIFAGGRIYNGNRLARVGEEVAKLKADLSQDEIIRNTASYYWQIVSLKEKLKTINSAKDQLAGVKRRVESAVKAGVTNNGDLLKVELESLELESNEIKVRNGIEIYKMLLAQYIGGSIKSNEFDVSDTAFINPDSPASYFIPAEEALLRRSESQLLDKSVEAQKLKVKSETGNYLPTVGVGASYFYHDLSGHNTRNSILFATVKVPISGWWGGSSAIKREKIELKKAINEKENNSALLKIDINQSWNELQQAYKQIEVARKAIASSSENLRLSTNNYNAGITDITDLLDAHTKLRQSNNFYSDACCDYEIKLIKYLQVTGQQ